MADQRTHIIGQLEQLKAELSSANFDPQKSGSLLSQLKVGKQGSVTAAMDILCNSTNHKIDWSS
jgi:hypothetical protein